MMDALARTLEANIIGSQFVSAGATKMRTGSWVNARREVKTRLESEDFSYEREGR